MLHEREIAGRILELAAARGVTLLEGEAALIDRYLQLLAYWNRRINLTALPLDGFPDRSLDKLAIEPLEARPLIQGQDLRWLDFGSGGGSPAVPLKVVLRDCWLTMIESKERKAAFLREVVRELDLVGSEVVCSRVQDCVNATVASTADVVTIRAVRLDSSIIGAAVTLLRPGGRLLVFSGGSAVLADLGRLLVPLVSRGVVRAYERTADRD